MKMTKRKKWFALILGILSVFMMVSCGSENQEAAVRETVDGFFTASKEGNYAEMKDYVTPEFDSLEEFLELGDLDPIDLLDESIQAFQISSDDLTDETKDAFAGLLDVMVTNVIRSYEITDVQADGSQATATVKWVTAYADPSAIDSVVGMNSDLDTMIEEYKQEYREQLEDLTEPEIVAWIFNAEFPGIFEEAAKNVSELSNVDMISRIALEKHDGKWLVREMTGGE